MLKGFKQFFSDQHSEHHHTPDESLHELPDHHLEARFHELHAQMEEVGHHLHKRGYHMEIEYKSEHAARHGRKASTLFYNHALKTPKTVSVSKSAIAIKRA